MRYPLSREQLDKIAGATLFEVCGQPARAPVLPFHALHCLAAEVAGGQDASHQAAANPMKAAGLVSVTMACVCTAQHGPHCRASVQTCLASYPVAPPLLLRRKCATLCDL
jgi:hypothetical protein